MAVAVAGNIAPSAGAVPAKIPKILPIEADLAFLPTVVIDDRLVQYGSAEPHPSAATGHHDAPIAIEGEGRSPDREVVYLVRAMFSRET
ncbi:hypothetical protein [Saccharothrix sp. NRRL B-16348]|uniref:hypothetical protein n=1 Tax=Saccharothrix sp. NRRL B-16348 TaxID=1415542 RepID=UPI0012F76464|nr:hypothetical protein [Saccharothrix sp. NRRL B-16348]